MNTKSVWLAASLSTALALCGIGMLTVACNCNDPVTQVDAAPPSNLDELGAQIDALPDGTHVSMLFVISVSNATVTPADENGQSTVVFGVDDVTAALGFTDRPQRYAFNITMPALASGWSEGTNSFEADPPNAIVEDSRSRVGVTEITSFNVEDNIVTVGLNRMAYKSVDDGARLDGTVENLRLFIDSGWLKVTGAGIAFGLQQAAKACVSVDCELWPLGA